MTKILTSIPAAVLAGMLALSCSSFSENACEQAAIDQALAEQIWTQEFEEHASTHDALYENPQSDEALHEHEHSAEILYSARVNMILAEAETHRECG